MLIFIFSVCPCRVSVLCACFSCVFISSRFCVANAYCLYQGDVLKLADFGSCRSIYSKPPYTEYISTRWLVFAVHVASGSIEKCHVVCCMSGTGHQNVYLQMDIIRIKWIFGVLDVFSLKFSGK